MASAPNLKVVDSRKADDAVREQHGVRCRTVAAERPAIVSVVESDNTIVLDATSSETRLTQWQARYLASKLYRLARRIRQRDESASA